jgi:hypothetical protein
VYGTPAKLVACSRRHSSQKHRSTTERSVSNSVAPLKRWLFTTDRP